MMNPIERKNKLMQLLRVTTAIHHLEEALLRLDETDLSHLDRAVLVSLRADLVKLHYERINEFLSDQEHAT